MEHQQPYLEFDKHKDKYPDDKDKGKGKDKDKNKGRDKRN
jgi:hypothetical protein